MLVTGWPLRRRPERSTASMVTAVKPQLLRGFDHAGAAAALVFHLVVEIGDLGARALGGNVLFQVRGDAFIGGFGRPARSCRS